MSKTHPITLKMEYGPKTANGDYATPEDAQAAYCTARDASGLGASKWGPAQLTKGSTQCGWISYNGRVWVSRADCLNTLSHGTILVMEAPWK